MVTVLGVSESARSLSSAFVHQAPPSTYASKLTRHCKPHLLQTSPVFLDILGFIVIKMFQASIDALVEKEVIPEVFNELI